MLPSLSISSNKNNDKKKDRKLEIARQLAMNILVESSRSKDKIVLQPISSNISSTFGGNETSNLSIRSNELIPLKDNFNSTNNKIEDQVDIIKSNIEALNSVNITVLDCTKSNVVAFKDPELVLKRMKRTLKIMSNSHFVYNMKFEKELITKKNLESFSEEINEISKRDKISLSVLIDTFKDRIKFALFGCEVDIGICSDANATEIEFFGNDYKRKIRKKDEASAFLCIEKNDVVLESISNAKFASPIRDMFSRSDSVVYVPLMGSSNPQGVCEIYGLQSDGITDSVIFERSDKALRAMIEAKDYKFKSNVRFWKKPPIIKKQQILENIYSRYHRVDCFLIAGYVTEICHTRKGIPYFGGPRFKVTWENGEVYEEVAAKDLLDLYRQTPRSLGCSSFLNDELSIKLLEIGKLMGKLIETQRMKTFLVKLRKSINSPSLRYQGIAEIGLQSITSMLNGCREVGLMGFNTSSRQSKHLVGYFPKRNNKVGETLEFNFSMEEVTMMTIKSINSTTNVTIQVDKNNTNWISLELRLCQEFYWHSPKDFDRFIVVINRDISRNGKLLEIETATIKSVLIEISASVELIWQKLVRKRNRMEILKHLEIKLFEWGSLLKNKDYLSDKVLDFIKNELPGANFYIGLLDSGSQSMEYVASSYRSKMLGVKLKRGEGVSFDVIDSLKTLILTPDDMDKNKYLKEGALIDIKYGGSFYRGRLGKNRGHEMFDVIYDFNHKSEAGVQINRIVPVISSFKAKQFGKIEFPFVCIPIRHKNKPLGVIGLDTISNIPRSPNESSPDADLLYFLEHLAKQMGTYMDTEVKKKSIKIINSISRNDNAIIYDVMEATNNILFSIIYSIRGVSAYRYIYEANEPLESYGFDHIHSKGDVTLDVKSRLKAFNINKVSISKYIFSIADNIVLLFLKMSSGKKEKEPKIYVFAMSLRSPITEPDYEYLESIQKIISSTIHNTVSKKVGSDLRRDALREIQAICSDSHSFTTIKSLYDRFIESIHLCFVNAHVYVGLLGSLNKDISYFLASYNSDMEGKKLYRDQGDFLSFYAVDNISTVAIGTRSDPMARKIFHFGNKQSFEYPFIAVPLVADIDSVIGVLGIDGCGDPGEESNINDLVNFFQEAGYSLSKIISDYKVQQILQKLVSIANNSKTYAEGLSLVKQVILDLLPYSLRVYDVVFEPREVPYSLIEKVSLETNNSGSSYYICFFRIIKIFGFGKLDKFNTIECIYHNEVIAKIACDKIDGSVPLHLIIPLTLSHNNSDSTLIISLLSSQGNEVGRKELPINYFLHVPTLIVSHSIFNRNIKESKIADVHIVSKLFLNSDIVGINVESVKLNGFLKQLMSNNNQSVLAKIKSQKCYFVIKWNESEILKSTDVLIAENNEWLSLNIDLKYDSSVTDDYLVIELWSKDKTGKCLILGQIKEKSSNVVNSMIYNSIQSEIFPSDNAIESSINFVIGSKFVVSGHLIKAETMKENQIIDELTLKAAKIEQVVDSLDVVANDKKIVSCELGILAAHDLYFNEEWGGQTNSYVLVSFNGVELSKSSIVYNTNNPVWDEELFIIKLPQECDVENCSLLLEIYHVFDDPTKKDLQIGVVELKNSMISKLLTGKAYRSFWFDVTKQENDDIDNNFIAKGEIKLSGRPLAVKSEVKKDTSRREKPIKIGLALISNLTIALDVREDLTSISMYCKCYFNNQRVYETIHINQYPHCDFKGDGFIINEPNDLEISRCNLRIEVFQSSINWRNDIIVGSIIVSGNQLLSLIGRKNIITKPFPISVEKSVDISERIVEPIIKILGGPVGSTHSYEDSETELSIDILAISALNNLSVNRSIISSRPRPTCLLYWNKKLIGKTKPFSYNSSNPQWCQERFYFNIPNINASLADILLCSLTIEIYDDSEQHNSLLLGLAQFKEKQLESLFNSKAAESNWFKIDSVEDLNSYEADENICEIKIRSGFSGADFEKTNWTEYQLDIINVRGLSNIDSFGGVDAFVIILWMNKEVGRTEIVENSNSPHFDNESFYLKYPLNTNVLDMELQFQVWSRRKSSRNVFLGQVILSDIKLFSFLKSNNNISEYELSPSLEMTGEENSLVSGYLSVKSSKNELRPFSEKLIQIYYINIEGAVNLKNNNIDGFMPEVHCRVFRTSLFETNEDIEIYRTAKVMGIDPVFANEYAVLRVHDADCVGLSIQFEFWDNTNDLLGTIVFKGESLLSLIKSSAKKDKSQSYELLVHNNYNTIMSKISLKCLSEEEFDAINITANNTEDNIVADSNELEDEFVDDLSLDSQVYNESVSSSQIEEVHFVSVESPAMKIQINIKSMNDFIMKSTKFGRGSGIFANLYWSDFTKPVYKTKVINSMTDLTFDNEFFIIEKKEGEELADCKLKISIYSKSTFSSDSFLAEVLLIKEDLVKFIYSGEDCSFSLINNPDKDPVQGTLVLSAKVLLDIDKLPIFNKRLNLPSSLKEVEIDIIRLTGIENFNNLYCIVKWGPVEIGRTTSIKNQTSPITWDENQSLTIRIPKTSSFDIPNLFESDLTLTIDIYDMLSANKVNLIESITISFNKIHENLMRFKFHRDWYSTDNKKDCKMLVLMTEKNIVIKDSKSEKQKIPLELDNQIKRNFKIYIPSAKDLQEDIPTTNNNKSTTLIKSIRPAIITKNNGINAYIKCRWNGKFIGKSLIVKSNTSPTWEDEYFTISEVSSVDILKSELYLEFWNWKSETSEFFLGSIQITGVDLKNLIENSLNEDTWLSFEPSDYICDSMKNIISGKAKIEVYINEVSEDSEDVSSSSVEITVHCAKDLSLQSVDNKPKQSSLLNAIGSIGSNIFGEAVSPFAVLKWGSKEIGRTKVIPKTSSPYWDESFIVNVDKYIDQSDLTINVWNDRGNLKGEFLGSAKIKKSIILESDLLPRTFYNLETTELSTTGSNGKIEIEIKYLKSSNNYSISQFIQINWINIFDSDAGYPVIKLSILSINNLPIGNYSPICKVKFGDDDIGNTSRCIYDQLQAISGSGKWEEEAFFISLSYIFDKNNKRTNDFLNISVWDKDIDKDKCFLGEIDLSFNELLRLYDGSYSYPLQSRSTKMKGMIIGELQFRMTFIFPFWDSHNLEKGNAIKRTIRVNGALNLPAVNDLAPNCKCSILIDENVRVRSSLATNNSFPKWSQCQVDLLLDLKKATDIIVVVYHVDSRSRKEIIVGQVNIPFDYLLRPPEKEFEIFLNAPVGQRNSNYTFTVSGSLLLQILSSYNTEDSSLPYSTRCHAPVRPLLVNSSITKIFKNKKKPVGVVVDEVVVDDELTIEEKLWLGTNVNYSGPGALAGLPKFIVLPISDMGIQIGSKKTGMIGSKPGNKLAFCIERPENKLSVSDVTLIDKISSEISNTLITLRRKDINRAIRDELIRGIKEFVDFYRNFQPKGIKFSDFVHKFIRDVMVLSFPGAIITVGFVTSDYLSIKYSKYKEAADSENKIYTLFKDQGSDWELIGKGFNIKSFTCSTVDDFNSRTIAIFGSMNNQILPRITIPLRAEDAHIGVIHLDNFVTHRESRKNEIIGEAELKKWLEEFGGLCGEYIYSEREMIMLAKIKHYLLAWDSSLIGMVKVAMQNSFEVLQGCRMLEIMQIDHNNHLKSLSQSKVIPIGAEEGHDVIIERISLTHTAAKAVTTGNMLSIGMSLFNNRKKVNAKTGNLLQVAPSNDNSANFEIKAVERIKNKIIILNKKTVNIVETSESNVNEKKTEETNDDEEDLDLQIEVADNLILGVAYDGIEYCQVLQFSTNSNLINMTSIPLKITAQKDIQISLYEVDKNLNIISIFYDEFTFSTFKESEISSNLHMPMSKFSYFNANLSLSWGKSDDTATNSSSEVTQKIEVKGYNINIIKATNLKINEKASHEGVDVFCEIYYNDKFVDKTTVKKKSRFPEWNEKFFIPQGKKRSSKIVIEVYEMNYLRKGAFLGKIEISKEQFMNSPDSPIDLELKLKDSVDTKKQLKVGGLLKLSYSTEYFQKEATTSQSDLPIDLWSMDRPSIKLVINSASGLAKANRFGGSSDPFVMVFVGDETEEPVFKTKVIDDCLDPKWEETVSINLGIKPEQNKTTINSFPVIRFEVYDYNAVAEMPFLGGCEIKPSQYFNVKSGDFQLKSIPSKKNSNLIQGTINLIFSIEDSFSSSDSFTPLFSPHRMLSCNIILEIEIVRAKNLMVTNRIGGKSDPYVVIKWNDKIWGETTYKKGNLNPHWTNEFFQVNLSSNGYNIGPLTLEMYDKDFFTAGQFMGEVKLDCDYILHPPSGPQELDLKPKPLSSLTDPKIDKKIQGSLTFQMSIIYKKQKLNIPQIKTAQASELQETSPAISVLLAHDPVLEANRQKSEKTHLPKVISNVSVKMQNYLNRPFERTGLISELHYGQLLASSRRGDHTILKAETVDMICIPTSTKEYNLLNKTEPILYMLGRYGPGKIPKRDIKSLLKIKDIFTDGSQFISDRAKRSATYHSLETSLRNITNLKDHFDQMIIQMLLEIQIAINITNVKLYLLNQNGLDFNEVVVREETILIDAKSDEFIKYASKICRLDYAIQISRNKCCLVDMEWLHATQANLPNLESAGDRIDEIEGPGWTSNFNKQILELFNTGGLIVPVIFHKEILIGMLLIKGIDLLPQSIYRRESLTNTTKFNEFSAPENGLINCVRSAAIIMAEAVLASRVTNTCRKLKTFPIRRDTTALSIIQNLFNQIVLCIPVVRSVCIWAVDMSQEISIQQIVTVKIVEDVPKGTMGKFMSSMKILKSSEKQLDKGVSVKRINNNDVNGNKPLDSSKPGIISGCFGAESFGESGYQIEKWTLGFPDSFKEFASNISLESNDAHFIDQNNDKANNVQKLNKEKLNTVHAEVVRCFKTLKQDSFQVLTGHTLVAVGTSDSSRTILRSLFPSDKINQTMVSEGFVNTAKHIETEKRSPRIKPAPLPKESHSQYKFFIAVNSYGTGNNDGWGSICENSRIHIANMVKILELNLTKLSEERDKSNNT